MIWIEGFGRTSNISEWVIRNDTGSAVTVQSVNLGWPVSNDALFFMYLGGAEIWSGEDLDPPTSVSSVGRSVSSSADLEAHFGASAAGSGYSLTVNFTNGCQAVAGN